MPAVTQTATGLGRPPLCWRTTHPLRPLPALSLQSLAAARPAAGLRVRAAASAATRGSESLASRWVTAVAARVANDTLVRGLQIRCGNWRHDRPGAALMSVTVVSRSESWLGHNVNLNTGGRQPRRRRRRPTRIRIFAQEIVGQRQMRRQAAGGGPGRRALRPGPSLHL